MPLESGSYISDLVAANPAHSDPLSQTDAHIRLLKSLILATFPNINNVVNATDEQLNALVAGTHQLADGSNATPSLSFISNPSMGLYNATPAGGYPTIGIAGNARLTGNGAVPTGAICDFFTAAIPVGWYELNGQAVPRTGQTASLFTMFGTGYGAGDGSTTFNLPDFTDRYRRQRGTWNVGAFLGDVIKSLTTTVSVSGANHNHAGGTAAVSNHTHGFSTVRGILNGGGGGGTVSAVLNTTDGSLAGLVTDPAGAQSAAVTIPDSGTLSMSGTGSYSGDVETRPKTVVVVSCIKA